jgi:hypothetical protein
MRTTSLYSGAELAGYIIGALIIGGLGALFINWIVSFLVEWPVTWKNWGITWGVIISIRMVLLPFKSKS